MLTSGQRLRGRFKVQGELKSGGMGKLYIASDKQSSKNCVLKVPLINGKHDDIKRDKLQIEADFLSGVSHPNIVRFIDSFKHNREPCLAIEYLEGETLDKRVTGPLDESQARKIILKVMETIEYIHTQGAVYRDLKPENIMVDNRDKRVTLIDFGLIRKTGNYTSPTLNFKNVSRVGTPSWTAPEQLNKGYASPQSDIFAIGTTAYYLLTAKAPPTTPTSPLNPAKESGVNVSKNLARVVYKATQIKPQSRFSKVDEMRRAIKGVAKQGPRLVVGGYTQFPLEIGKSYKIGRKGSSKLGSKDIVINDPDPQSNYISREHAKLFFNRKGELIIEDLSSLNGTWLLVKGDWRRIKPGNPWKLPNGSMVAFAYDSNKGPYVTATVKGL